MSLIAFGFLDAVRYSPAFQWSFFGTGAVLLAWNVGVFGFAQRTGRLLTLEIALRKQHYVQASAQAVFLLYWGWHWRPVYDSAFLIAAQLVFAYAFDMLLCWSRRGTYTFGFGPFPIIFSINLFLWFGDDWFYMQFLLVALGFAAKELIRWNKGGRRVHIFNPSSFPLAVFSLGLILTGTSDLTWGQDIAISQFYPPHAYLALFLVGLPGQYLFGVTSMTVVRRGGDLRVRAALHRGDRDLFLLRFVYSDCRVPRHAPSCSRIRPRRHGPSWDASCSACSTA